MNKICVGKEARILTGKCAGIVGLVVGANSLDHSVELKIEDGNYFTTTYDNISQGVIVKCEHDYYEVNRTKGRFQDGDDYYNIDYRCKKCGDRYTKYYC